MMSDTHMHTDTHTHTHTHTYSHTPTHTYTHGHTPAQYTHTSFIYSFILSGHFYSTPSSPLLLRGAPDYSTDTVSEFHAEAHRQLQVEDLPKVSTWRLERESNPRPSG